MTLTRMYTICMLLVVLVTTMTHQPSDATAQTPGVPSITPGYGSPIESWWASHPYNPAASGYIPPGSVTSPSNVINAAAPNLQAAVDACPTTGCQIRLSSGATYDSAVIVGKHHMHIVGNGAVVRGQIWIAGCEAGVAEARGQQFGQLPLGVRNHEPWAIDCVTTGRASDIYVRDLTMDGNGQHNVLIHVRATVDLLVDRVTFRNTITTGGHPGQFIAGVWADNIAVRASSFTGQTNWASYIDGCHGCVFEGNDLRQFDPNSGMFLALTNDDFSGDINGDGTTDSNAENRMSQYVVWSGNRFGTVEGGRTAFQHQGQHLLITGNILDRVVTNFSHSNARSPVQVYPRSYDYFNINVRDNVVTGSVGGDFATFAADPAAIQDCQRVGRSPDTCMKLGRYAVTGNRVGTGVGRWVVEAGDPTWAPMFDPRTASDNTIGGASTATNTPTATLTAPTATHTPQVATNTPTATTAAPTATVVPADAMRHTIFDDANRHNATTFDAFVRDAKARGFYGIVLTNGSRDANDALLTVADKFGGIKVWLGAMEETNAYVEGSAPATISAARSVAYPIADKFKWHPSFKGYYIRDEPTAIDGPKVKLLAQAFKEKDSPRDRFVMLNDNDTDVRANWSADMTFLAISIYPADQPDKPECQFDNLFTSYVAAQRARTSQTVPLMIALQTHGDVFGLRYPTLQEMRGQARMARDDSHASVISWFAYTSQQGWVGLKDSPDRLDEASRIARGTQTGPSCDGGVTPTSTPTSTPVPPTNTPTPTPQCVARYYLNEVDTGRRETVAITKCQ